MRSVPEAIASGSCSHDLESCGVLGDPVATAPGTDLTDQARDSNPAARRGLARGYVANTTHEPSDFSADGRRSRIGERTKAQEAGVDRTMPGSKDVHGKVPERRLWIFDRDSHGTEGPLELSPMRAR